MLRFCCVFVVLMCVPCVLHGQGTGGTGPCYQEATFTCAEQGVGFQGQCLMADCEPVHAGSGAAWKCLKEKGLTLNAMDPRVWWDVFGAPLGVAGSTSAGFLVPPLTGCGTIIWCDCDPENTWKCTDGATFDEFIPDQQRIMLPLDCVGT